MLHRYLPNIIFQLGKVVGWRLRRHSTSSSGSYSTSFSPTPNYTMPTVQNLSLQKHSLSSGWFLCFTDNTASNFISAGISQPHIILTSSDKNKKSYKNDVYMYISTSSNLWAKFIQPHFPTLFCLHCLRNQLPFFFFLHCSHSSRVWALLLQTLTFCMVFIKEKKKKNNQTHWVSSAVDIPSADSWSPAYYTMFYRYNCHEKC